MRALLLELERLHNHVADLGAMANDVGVRRRATRTRSGCARRCCGTTTASTGHRLLRGGVTWAVPGWSRCRTRRCVRAPRREVAELVDVALGTRWCVDRFTGTAVLRREDARPAWACSATSPGPAGWTSTRRRDHPFVDLAAEPASRVADASRPVT